MDPTAECTDYLFATTPLNRLVSKAVGIKTWKSNNERFLTFSLGKFARPRNTMTKAERHAIQETVLEDTSLTFGIQDCW